MSLRLRKNVAALAVATMFMGSLSNLTSASAVENPQQDVSYSSQDQMPETGSHETAVTSGVASESETDLPAKESVQSIPINFNVNPSRLSVGETTTIEVTLAPGEGDMMELPDALPIMIADSTVQAMRVGDSATYRTTYSPTMAGRITIGTFFGDSTAFTVIIVSEKAQPGGSSSSGTWKIVGGILGALGAIGALIAGALSFLPRIFKF